MNENSVLIIDDDIWMQRILSKTLESYGFSKTFMASNGFEGIALAVEYKPTLIILDIFMPELSGHLTLKILKNIKITSRIPVLMVSALSDTENLGLAVKSGTAGFISKPFTKATIYDKLLAIFGKEKLEIIQRGEFVEISEPIHESIQRDASVGKNVTGSEKTTNFESVPKPPKVASGIKTTKDNLLKHYQEDEKRSIESIKKLLLKPKK